MLTRPKSAVVCGTRARPAFQHLLDFLIAGKLTPIGLGYTLLDLFNLPPFQLLELGACFPWLRHLYAAPNRTDTSFDTPGSCIVTP